MILESISEIAASPQAVVLTYIPAGNVSPADRDQLSWQDVIDAMPELWLNDSALYEE